MAMDPVRILLVENDPTDIARAEETLKNSEFTIELDVVGDGVEALAYLERQGRFRGMALPDLVLLDLNLPRKSGLEVLAEIRSNAAFRFLPVVVLTTSASAEDIAAAYDLGANCYIMKPVDLQEFASVVNGIQTFWLTVVKLPTRAGDDAMM